MFDMRKCIKFFAIATGLLVYPLESYSQDLLGNLKFRNIGPANQGGRIVDIEAHTDDFTKVYVATGSGGIWKSENAGTTWKPIFDDYETASIGDIALDPSNEQVIWVGTGEANNRNSVSWGNGVYKSVDGGASFERTGLESTHQIARVLVHPDNSEDVCVCAIGHLWGYSGDRGLFHTKDGGTSWSKHTNGLPDDGKTGCIDLVRDPQNPEVLYAAFYHRLRKPWHFHSGGGEGGIYKSTDGGQSWSKLTNGLPGGPTGRIGLAIYQGNSNILMAIVEAERSESLDNPGSGIYRTEDGGDTWQYVNTYNNRPFYYSQIRINPHDDQRVYILTTTFRVSEDGGTTLSDGSADREVHGDFHAMWLDPSYQDRYYLGADKGLSITHDHGKGFQLLDNLPIAQYYRINYDMRDPYYVYGGLQDNGSYATASFSRDARGILNDDNWKMHWGDGQDAAFNPFDHTDGYSSTENGNYFKYNPDTREIRRISPTSANTINHKDYFPDTITDLRSAIRFNWSAPLILSSHDPSTVYVAGNHVYKSIDQGDSWQIISPDLSTNDPVMRKQGVSGGITPDNTGAETHCSVYALSVSEISDQIIWAGTDDGNIQITKDGGLHWENVRNNLFGVPEGIWVSRVEASKFSPGRVYVTFDGHRSDNNGTWVYKSEDFGQTWEKITEGISAGESVRVIREDLVNPDLLFIGTETGVWYSLNRGSSWVRMKHGLPTVSVYDIKIHPRENDLIIGTHGRSLWIMDDISPLQQLTQSVRNSTFHLFEQEPATLWHNVSRGGQRGHFLYAGENPAYIQNTSDVPRAGFESLVPITFYSGSDAETMQLAIRSNSGLEAKMELPVHQGINRFYWNREFDAQEYTSEEQASIENLLEELMKTNLSSYFRRLYNRFMNADTSKEKRRILSPLTSSYRGGAVPVKYGIQKAGAGVYTIELSVEGEVQRGSVRIVNDILK